MEKKVTSLQAEIEKLKEERKHEVEEETAEIDLPTREDKSERSSDGPSIIDLEKIEDGESFRNARIKESKGESSILFFKRLKGRYIRVSQCE